MQRTATIEQIEKQVYSGMTLVTERDFQQFVKRHKEVKIENVSIPIGQSLRIDKYAPPESYKHESFTVWSFPDRGDWSTHDGKYRGNWSPYIPHNLIWKYTEKGDLVLDQMMGSGTTLVECKLLGRNAIGIDVNPGAVMVALDRLNFDYDSKVTIKTYSGDARNLNKVEDDSIDLVATHPPYAGIIPYSRAQIKADLSALSIDNYLREMRIVAEESFRVVKPGKHCAILIGDTRRHRHYIPISHNILRMFLDAGFILKEDIIKVQHKTKRTREAWRGSNYDFYKIAHEHLYIFRKPSKGEKTSQFKHSMNLF
ncbi:MAG: TRM11 family SAM-dependent methyltransferase [Nitrososphaerales archaeon]